jgi:hypothetical protein
MISMMHSSCSTSSSPVMGAKHAQTKV